MYTGGAGGYSFYVRGGEQVVRQRKNNSNYGESASRSESQQMRRVRWANLVNFYKSISSWQPKAYEAKSAGQTDYNLFMSLNIGYSQIALTKDMALNGCACVAGYTISRGSLPSIETALYDPADGHIVAITLSSAITSGTTVGQFATDVIANNPAFKANDNLAFIIFNNIQQFNNYPYVSSVYKEVTLDINSATLLSSVIGTGRFEKTSTGNLKVNVGAANSHEAGFTLIHTRRTSSGLQVSTQSIWATSEAFWQEYSGDAWVQQCIDTYGVDSTVPLDPGEGAAGERFVALFPTAFNGAGVDYAHGQAFQLPVGRYRVTPSPSLWDLDAGTTSSQIVFDVSSSPTAEFNDGEITFVERIDAQTMASQGGVPSIEFTVTSSTIYYRIGGRADSEVVVTAMVFQKV